MKKILLLGGSAQQVVAIETAKRLGYYTVLCDFLVDNPGQYVADKYYLVSTTDKEAVLQVAKKEMVSGVLAYASDPAAPTAAYIAEQMNLPGSPYNSVEILCNKDKFRAFLSENGFCTPKACGYSTVEDALKDIRAGRFKLPIIVKPVDSSGSKGTTVLHSLSNVNSALDFAFSFSRSHRIIIEEFIEKNHPYLIGGDIFILNGQVVVWGLMNCYRDVKANPLVPVGKSYPVQLGTEDLTHVKGTLQRLVNLLEFKNGSMNVELVVDKSGRVWPIDIGPRSGGNMIPDLLGYIFHVDIAEMSVKVSMGTPIEMCEATDIPYYATHNLHSIRDGSYRGIEFDSIIEPYMIKKCLYKRPGDKVEFFDNASKALGIMFMKFESQENMDEVLTHISEHIQILLDE